ncbi:SRPBCC family protein [Sphingomonas baiyangensis]|uniref:SRPBCC family protein n=1 Tax=Sphingomonas baiyangensis TaxID=2572576 RepID=A0A4U1L136_9SPHN|nr:SRPBCC family protein [Sphingomonas baiyangensis]TKD50489.1 SRPBCC family protein [Sphingomonas baiyangensis]
MQRKTLSAAGGAAALLAIGGGLLLARSSRPHGAADDAPGRTARRSRFGDYAVVGKTVTIMKPSRDELFAFWRDFTNLPAFMDNLDMVELLGDDRSRWTIRAPGGGTVSVETRIAEEKPGRIIAWRSVEGSDIDTEGRVRFSDAPGGGTEVELVIAYIPPFGRAGQAVAKLLQREPAIQARRDLRRFRMLMETGEIATSERRLETEEKA